jgi:hypothetical protein
VREAERAVKLRARRTNPDWKLTTIRTNGNPVTPGLESQRSLRKRLSGEAGDGDWGSGGESSDESGDESGDEESDEETTLLFIASISSYSASWELHSSPSQDSPTLNLAHKAPCSRKYSP